VGLKKGSDKKQLGTAESGRPTDLLPEIHTADRIVGVGRKTRGKSMMMVAASGAVLSTCVLASLSMSEVVLRLFERAAVITNGRSHQVYCIIR
jgi:hypothetical protein